jgi:hypothetical protein
MALITVREKDNPDAPLIEVDERWVERWPEDFEVVRDADATAAADATQSPSTQPKAPAKDTPEGESTGDAATRGRF